MQNQCSIHSRQISYHCCWYYLQGVSWLYRYLGFLPRYWVHSHNGVIKKGDCHIISKKTESQKQHKGGICNVGRELMSQAWISSIPTCSNVHLKNEWILYTISDSTHLQHNPPPIWVAVILQTTGNTSLIYCNSYKF